MVWKDEVYGKEVSPYETDPGLVKRKCYEAYMLCYADKEDLREFGVPESVLNSWLYEPGSGYGGAENGVLSWKQQRDSFYEGQLKTFMNKRAKQMKGLASRMLNIANRSLTEIDEKGQHINVRDLEKLFNAFHKLQHWIQVEDGKPTSISHSTNLSKEEIKVLIEEVKTLDPFLGGNSMPLEHRNNGIGKEE